MELKLTMTEAYVIFKAVEARCQYITDDFEAPQEELEFLQSVYDKMRELKADLVIINSETSHNNDLKNVCSCGCHEDNDETYKNSP